MSLRDLENPTPCMLVVQDTTTANQLVVADGKAYPCPEGVLHGVKMMSEHYKVSLDWLHLDHGKKLLHVPSSDGKTTTVGQTTNHLLMCPIDGFIFKGKEAPPHPVEDKTISTKGNIHLAQSITTKNPISEKDLTILELECKQLHFMLQCEAMRVSNNIVLQFGLSYSYLKEAARRTYTSS